MPFLKRHDGTHLRDLPHFTLLLPYLMPDRLGSTIFFEEEFDLTECLVWLKQHNRQLAADQPRVTFFQLFLCGAVRTLALRPKMNRFVSGHRYYQRNRISVNFVAKRELHDDGQEINVTIPFSPFETLKTLPTKVTRVIRETMTGMSTEADSTNALLVKLPRWLLKPVFAFLKGLDYWNLMPRSMIDSLPFYSSIFLTNVGSVGIDAPLHHNFELGTCGIFIALGTMKKVPVLQLDGSVKVRDRVRVTFTFDDRIIDGVYSGKTIAMFRQFVEQPAALLEVPVLSPEVLAEHRLAANQLEV